MYKAKKTTLWLTSFLVLVVCSEKTWSSDNWDQEVIVDSFLKANSEDRALAQSIAEQARRRISATHNSLKTNLGPLLKLWCDAAVIAPDPENLKECARFHFQAVKQMSNPQPSEAIVRIQRARESLAMIRAALEIAGGDPDVSDALRYRLKGDAACFRGIISDTNPNDNCNNWE
jgi:hypothetical protein